MIDRDATAPAGPVHGALVGAPEARLQVLSHDLVERIKELNCLYGISRLVEREGISLQSLLQGVVDLMPAAWQYPEVTAARIQLRNRQFITEKFSESVWKQQEAIVVSGRRAGRLEVVYLSEKPQSYEGPFLSEERDLIHGIAERLGHIIESKKAEASLHRLYIRERRLRKRLETEMRNRVDLTRHLMHELKTPLTSLLATSQLLTEETRGTRLEKMAAYVWGGASSLNSRIDELHDVIRGELGGLKLNTVSVGLDKMLSSVVEETRAFAGQHGVTVELELPSHSLPRVKADAERVRQVLLNLINNACRYAAAGKRVIIRARAGPESGMVTVEIKDFGPGIPKQDMKRLFKPGYMVARSESAAGLGIGLTLCKLMIELQGGKIWAQSIPGSGSSFFFTLPRAP